MRVRKQDGWLCAKVGDELVMMSVQKGHYIGLNDVGARVWALLDQPSDVDGICAQLVCEFEVAPDVCRTEIDQFLQDLVKHGAATLDP
jgi:hypothetical protein